MTIRALSIAGALALSAPAQAQTPEPLTCLLTPARISDLGTELRATVVEVPVARADRVSQGAALVELDRSLAQADLALAEIAAASLRDRLARTERLARSRLIPTDDLSQLRTDLALAEAELARARSVIERATVRAPFDGFVARIDVAVGELTDAEPLLQLIDVATLRAEMTFPDGDFGRLSPGRPLRLAVDLVDREVDAVVIATDPFLDPASNTFTVTAEIANPDLTLPAGAGCRLLPS